MSALYWLVHRANGSNPHVKHETIGEAREEAQRIAVKHPKDDVHVLEIVETWVATPGEAHKVYSNRTTM